MSGPKSEARAARRAGKISPRQQKKLRKRDHRLVAPNFYGLDLPGDVFWDIGRGDTTVVQQLSLGDQL